MIKEYLKIAQQIDQYTMDHKRELNLNKLTQL